MTARGKSIGRSSKAASAPVGTDDDALPDLTPLVMGGRFVDDVIALARTNSELFLGTGRLATERVPVLVPFIDMTFLGVRQKDINEAEGEPDLTPVFQQTLTLENALWLAFDVMRDIRAECVTLGKLARGEVGLDPARLAHARFFAEKAREQAEMCVSLFDELTQAAGGISPTGDPYATDDLDAAIAEPAEAVKAPTAKPRRLRLAKKPQKST